MKLKRLMIIGLCGVVLFGCVGCGKSKKKKKKEPEKVYENLAEMSVSPEKLEKYTKVGSITDKVEVDDNKTIVINSGVTNAVKDLLDVYKFLSSGEYNLEIHMDEYDERGYRTLKGASLVYFNGSNDSFYGVVQRDLRDIETVTSDKLRYVQDGDKLVPVISFTSSIDVPFEAEEGNYWEYSSKLVDPDDYTKDKDLAGIEEETDGTIIVDSIKNTAIAMCNAGTSLKGHKLYMKDWYCVNVLDSVIEGKSLAICKSVKFMESLDDLDFNDYEIYLDVTGMNPDDYIGKRLSFLASYEEVQFLGVETDGIYTDRPVFTLKSDNATLVKEDYELPE